MRGGGRGTKTAPSLHRHWDPWYGIRSVLARTKRRLAITCKLRWLRRVMVSQACQASLPVREIVIGWGAFIPFAAWRASSWPYISLPYSLPLSCTPRDHPSNSFWKVQTIWLQTFARSDPYRLRPTELRRCWRSWIKKLSRRGDSPGTKPPPRPPPWVTHDTTSKLQWWGLNEELQSLATSIDSAGLWKSRRIRRLCQIGR